MAEALARALNMADLDGDGKLDATELAAMLAAREDSVLAGVREAMTKLLSTPAQLSSRVNQAQYTEISKDLAGFFQQLDFDERAPPIGYKKNTDAGTRKRFPVIAEQSDILVCEPIDFSTPGEISCFVYHYTQRKI